GHADVPFVNRTGRFISLALSSSCGCASAVVDNNVLSPNQETIVRVRLWPAAESRLAGSQVDELLRLSAVEQGTDIVVGEFQINVRAEIQNLSHVTPSQL